MGKGLFLIKALVIYMSLTYRRSRLSYAGVTVTVPANVLPSDATLSIKKLEQGLG